MSVSATTPDPIPSERFEDADFLAACKGQPRSLVYFLLNVGDGDTQLILLPSDPEDPQDTRQAVVVDVATQDKLPALVEELARNVLLPERLRGDEFPIVIGTHPHDDHIAGMPQFLAQFGEHIAEYWDSGYYHPTPSYLETMVHLEGLKKRVLVTQPTSGMTRYLGTMRITVLAPGVGLRRRFDTYGVNINDASIALKLEFPASRIVQVGENRAYQRSASPWSLLLGADAQTTSWAEATEDYHQLEAQIFKVPHHASKHGVNVELVDLVQPRVALVSSVGGAGRFNFPHRLALEAIREGMEPTTRRRGRSPDYDLTLLFTSDRRGRRSMTPLGSIALLIPPRRGSDLSIWRFLDEPGDTIDLRRALRFIMS
jgi:beta-lactamase superfamily II metal-dependent hydrolase